MSSNTINEAAERELAELREFETWWQKHREETWRSTLTANETGAPVPLHWSAGFRRQTLIGWQAARATLLPASVEPIILNGMPVENIQLDWCCRALTNATIFNGDDLLQAFDKLVAFYVANRATQPAPAQEMQASHGAVAGKLTKGEAECIRRLALDLEKTGRITALSEGQEKSDFMHKNREIQCALEDVLTSLTSPASTDTVPNFCQVCGKRTPDGSIHTCTPPEAAASADSAADAPLPGVFTTAEDLFVAMGVDDKSIAALERDAARYRWLLDNYARGDGYTEIDAALNDGEPEKYLSPAIDAQIAAIQAKDA